MTFPIEKYDLSCVFCREQNESRNTNFAKLYPDLDSRNIIESDNLAIFPCIGQLTDKHCLIVTKRHFNTFAQASNSGKISSDEIQELILNFAKQYMSNTEHLLCFEHGALCEEVGGCGIYHAHIHLIPIKDKISISSLYNFSGAPMDSLAASLAALDPNKSYIMAGLFDLNKIYIEERKIPLASQYLRKQLAGILNVDNWDWRLCKKQTSLVNMLINNAT